MAEITSFERLRAVLNGKIIDRLPFFFPLATYGAKELGLSPKEYFSKSDYVVHGQLHMQKKYGYDFLFSYFYISKMLEPWSGETIFSTTGYPLSGEPIIRNVEKIRGLECPAVKNSASLAIVLDCIQKLKQGSANRIPIIGVVISPFTLPSMQLGLSTYIEVLFERPDLFEYLLQINKQFCIEWAEAQIRAGADIIAYVDPVSAPQIMPESIYKQIVLPLNQEMTAAIKAPTILFLAASPCKPRLKYILNSGFSVVTAGSLENIGEVINKCQGKIAVAGNLNSMEMCSWTAQEVKRKLSSILEQVKQNGPCILSDSHAEMPWEIKEETLLSIAEVIRNYKINPSGS